jgi:hypothetical protein
MKWDRGNARDLSHQRHRLILRRRGKIYRITSMSLRVQEWNRICACIFGHILIPSGKGRSHHMVAQHEAIHHVKTPFSISPLTTTHLTITLELESATGQSVSFWNFDNGFKKVSGYRRVSDIAFESHAWWSLRNIESAWIYNWEWKIRTCGASRSCVVQLLSCWIHDPCPNHETSCQLQ